MPRDIFAAGGGSSKPDPKPKPKTSSDKRTSKGKALAERAAKKGVTDKTVLAAIGRVRSEAKISSIDTILNSESDPAKLTENLKKGVGKARKPSTLSQKPKPVAKPKATPKPKAAPSLGAQVAPGGLLAAQEEAFLSGFGGVGTEEPLPTKPAAPAKPPQVMAEVIDETMETLPSSSTSTEALPDEFFDAVDDKKTAVLDDIPVARKIVPKGPPPSLMERWRKMGAGKKLGVAGGAGLLAYILGSGIKSSMAPKPEPTPASALLGDMAQQMKIQRMQENMQKRDPTLYQGLLDMVAGRPAGGLDLTDAEVRIGADPATGGDVDPRVMAQLLGQMSM